MEFREWPEHDDGWPVHAPVDAGAPNPFGLVHVLGNVSEWVADPRTDYAGAQRGAAGLAVAPGNRRVHRGGAFTDNALHCRAATRGAAEPDYLDSVLGVRPARPWTR
jgi:formylglycine-generating enzyme